MNRQAPRSASRAWLVPLLAVALIAAAEPSRAGGGACADDGIWTLAQCADKPAIRAFLDEGKDVPREIGAVLSALKKGEGGAALRLLGEIETRRGDGAALPYFNLLRDALEDIEDLSGCIEIHGAWVPGRVNPDLGTFKAGLENRCRRTVYVAHCFGRGPVCGDRTVPAGARVELSDVGRGGNLLRWRACQHRKDGYLYATSHASFSARDVHTVDGPCAVGARDDSVFDDMSHHKFPVEPPEVARTARH